MSLDLNLSRGLDRSFRSMLETFGMPQFGVADFRLSTYLEGIYPVLTTQSLLTTIGPGNNGLTINAVPALNLSDHLVSVQNDGVEVFWINADGTITPDAGLPDQAGHSGQFLTTNGTSSSWATNFSIGNFSGTPTAKGLDVTSNVLTLHAADGTSPGAVSTSAQTFAGDKTFTGSILGNPATIKGTAADSGSAVGTILDTSTLWVNAGAKLVSVRTNNTEKFYIKADGTITPDAGLPSQTGQAGNVLTTNGSVSSWVNPDTVFNVKYFGAVGEDDTDDTDAILAAIAAAEAARDAVAPTFQAQTVYFPTGIYRIRKPLFTTQGIMFVGDGRYSSIIRWDDDGVLGDRYNGYTIVAAAKRNTGNGLQYSNDVPPGVTGRSLLSIFEGSFDLDEFFIDLTQHPTGRLPTNSHWTVNLTFQVVDTLYDFRDYFYIGNAIYSGDTSRPSTCLGFSRFDSSTPMKLFFRYNGQLFSPTVTFPSGDQILVNTWHNLQICWTATDDAPNNRLLVFLDGELWTNGTWAPTGGSGTPDSTGFLQYEWESTTIGRAHPLFAIAPSSVDAAYQPTKLSTFYIQNRVLHTTDFTPDYSKPTFDATYQLLLNFEAANDYLGCPMGQSSSMQHIYYYPICGTPTEYSFVQVRDLSFYGGLGGIYNEFASQMTIDNVSQLGAGDGWHFERNPYFSNFNNIDVQAAGGRAAWIATGMSYSNMTGINVRSPLNYIMNAANISGTSWQATDGHWSMMCGGGGQMIINGFSVDNELNVAAPWIGALVTLDMAQLELNNPTLYNPPNFTNSAPTILAYRNDANSRIVINNNAGIGGTTDFIKFVGPITDWGAKALEFNRPIWYFSSTPTSLANILTNVRDSTAATARVTTAISADLTRDTQFVIVRGNSTAVTLTLPLANTVPMGTYITIKDADRHASTYNIIVARSGSDLIDGDTSQTINTDGTSITLETDNVSEWYIT